MEFLVHGATRLNEPGVFLAFEETETELSENVRSMGFDLPALCARKKLFLDSVRVERSEIAETGEYNLEGLFIRLENAIRAVGAKRVVLDTLESLFCAFGNVNLLRAELRRLFRWLKSKGLTAIITAESAQGKLTRYGIEEYVADCVIVLDHRVEDQSSIRRLRSIGIDLERWIRRGLLQFYASRPGTFGLEKHLVTIHDVTSAFKPKVVIIDPITNFASVGTRLEVKSMVTRLIDLFKTRQITAMFTSLTTGDSSPELSEVGVSSQMDAWLLLRNLESDGERNRGLYVLKARGIAHSNQIREFMLADHGAQLVDVYVGASGVLTGSARVAQEGRECADEADRKLALRRKNTELKQKRQRLEEQIATM